MAMYSATCNGGPFDGKPLHHPEDRFELVKRERRVQPYLKGYVLQPGEERGAYVHTGDRWEWTKD